MAADPHHILVVDDDVELAREIRASLVGEGYRVSLEHDGHAAEAAIRSLTPDLVVLDVMLPGRSGFDICRSLRPRITTPIILLTGRGDDLDQVVGLELGADDYIAKPVRPRVLSARIGAVLRRARPAGDWGAGSMTFGPITLSAATREVRVSGALIELTDSEFELLQVLASRAGEVVSREELYQTLRGIAYNGTDRSMDLRVSKVRGRLRERLGGRSPIRTVRGQGYLFVPPSEP